LCVSNTCVGQSALLGPLSLEGFQLSLDEVRIGVEYLARIMFPNSQPSHLAEVTLWLEITVGLAEAHSLIRFCRKGSLHADEATLAEQTDDLLTVYRGGWPVFTAVQLATMGSSDFRSLPPIDRGEVQRAMRRLRRLSESAASPEA
jgi:hypothetical protein